MQSYRCSGILTWFPFASFHFQMVFNLSLRIDSPIFNYCFYGTFLHFSLQVLHTESTPKKNGFFLSLEYLLLLPRSVLITISYKITLTFQHYDHIFLQLRTSSLKWKPIHPSIVLNSQSKSTISASSIFRTNSFGRWVITHSLADFDFHDHRPTVSMN